MAESATVLAQATVNAVRRAAVIRMLPPRKNHIETRVGQETGTGKPRITRDRHTRSLT